MTSPSTPVDRARTGATSRGQAAEWLGTAGWAAKGVVYLLVAVIALQLAVSGGQDQEASKQGAMQKLADQPAGTVLLTLVVVGLVAYALYSLLSVFLPGAGGAVAHDGPKESGTDGGKAWAKDAKHLGTAVAYGAFAAQGAAILLGRSKGGGDTTRKTWSATLLSSTPGTVLLALVAVGFVVLAGFQITHGLERTFMRHLDCHGGGLVSRETIEWSGVVGHVARGVVAALFALFIAVAVLRHDPNEVRGLDGALRTVQSGPAGPPLLVVVALGLGGYGVFSLISARCRRHEDG